MKLIELPTRLNAKEAAEILGISESTASEMMRSGELGHYRYKRKRYTTDAHIAAFLEQHEVTPACQKDGSDSEDTGTENSDSCVALGKAAGSTAADRTHQILDRSKELASALRTLTKPSSG